MCNTNTRLKYQRTYTYLTYIHTFEYTYGGIYHPLNQVSFWVFLIAHLGDYIGLCLFIVAYYVIKQTNKLCEYVHMLDRSVVYLDACVLIDLLLSHELIIFFIFVYFWSFVI